jgi:hypothetical protein
MPSPLPLCDAVALGAFVFFIAIALRGGAEAGGQPAAVEEPQHQLDEEA